MFFSLRKHKITQRITKSYECRTKKYILVYGFIAMLLIIDFHKISYLTLERRINEIKILNRNQYCGNVKWSEFVNKKEGIFCEH